MLKGFSPRCSNIVFCSLVACATILSIPLSALSAENAADSSDTMTIERASGERLAEATGHYARSRALLLQSLREFDRARVIARPDSLINSEEWRNTLLGRAEDLEKILSPQPRASAGGVRFDSAQQLLNADQGGAQ